jgi:HUS1 checkpoint protein
MRFRAEIRNVHTFTKFTASLATLGHIAWVRLDSKDVRFTVIPEQGTQVWSVLTPESIFDTFTIQSAAPHNTINLEVPLAPLQRALKSAHSAYAANIRLTKKDNIPLLSLTITTLAPKPSGPMSSNAASNGQSGFGSQTTNGVGPETGTDGLREESVEFFGGRVEHDTVITQDIPIRVLAPASVEGLHEPRCRDPDVHIVLPNLTELKSISERFTKLALSTKNSTRTGFAGSTFGPKLELSANMHGCLRLSLKTDSMNISTLWTSLENPELDPDQVANGEEGLANHPSTRMKAMGDATGQSEEGWATVRLDGRDWGRVLSVGRLGGRVIACFCDEHALILYVFLSGESPAQGDSVLTVSLSLIRDSPEEMLTGQSTTSVLTVHEGCVGICLLSLARRWLGRDSFICICVCLTCGEGPNYAQATRNRVVLDIGLPLGS